MRAESIGASESIQRSNVNQGVLPGWDMSVALVAQACQSIGWEGIALRDGWPKLAPLCGEVVGIPPDHAWQILPTASQSMSEHDKKSF